MSIPMQVSPTPAAVFQSHFGTPPGTQAAETERTMWEQLCGEVLADIERLQLDLLPTPTYIPRSEPH
jgi:hypothetical protein